MRKQREYCIGDLQAIVNQMGGRLHLQIVPEELCQPQLDPHALAMALQLADLLEDSDPVYYTDSDIDPDYEPETGEWGYCSRWLRAEVQKELESQP